MLGFFFFIFFTFVFVTNILNRMQICLYKKLDLVMPCQVVVVLGGGAVEPQKGSVGKRSLEQF